MCPRRLLLTPADVTSHLLYSASLLRRPDEITNTHNPFFSQQKEIKGEATHIERGYKGRDPDRKQKLNEVSLSTAPKKEYRSTRERQTVYRQPKGQTVHVCVCVLARWM